MAVVTVVPMPGQLTTAFCLLVLGIAVAGQQDIPPELSTTFNEQVLHAGEEIALRCRATGVPSPVINWSKDGTSLSKDSVKGKADPEGKMTSWYNVTNARTEDGGVYQCQASNKAGGVSYEARINVHGHLSSRIRPPMNVVSGTSVWLNCPIYGYPIDNISWEKDGNRLPLSVREILFKNMTLHVSELQRGADDGEYICTASNKNGEIVQGKIQLNILLAPKILPFAFQDDLIREGSRARVQCVVSEGDLPITIHWFKDGKPLSTEQSLSIRNLDEFSSILTISAINPRHNGNYTCVATNAAATTTHSATLAVNVPPKILPFAFQDDQFFKGMRAHIICAVSQGDTPLHFQWLKDDSHILPALGVITRSYDGHANSLSIESVSASHTGNYTCVVNNQAATVSHTAQLLVYVPPKIVPFAFPSEPMLEGILVRVSCVVSRGDLPLSISWLKDGITLATGRSSIVIRDFDEYSSVLSIDPLTTEHSGNYTCIAKNHAATATHTASLSVMVPPRWIHEPKDAISIKGVKTMLICQADGFPKPDIQWLKVEGSDLTGRRQIIRSSTHKNIQILSNGSLVISDTSEEDEGFYFCIAKNGVGSGLSRSILLSVNAPPRFQASSQNITSHRGNSALLTCQATGDLPMNFTWRVNGQDIGLHTTKSKRFRVNFLGNVTKDTAKSEFTIFSVKMQDSNAYDCTAKNAYGFATFIVYLAVQEPPSSPEITRADAIGDGRIQIWWTIHSDGRSPLTAIYVEYQIKGQKEMPRNISLLPTQSTSVLSELIPAQTYLIRMSATNAVGGSDISAHIAVVTSEEVPTGAPRKVQVESIDKKSLRITWQPPEKHLQNGILRGYHVGYKIKSSNESYTFDHLDVPEDYSEDLIYQLSDLQMYSQYSIVVQAYNKKGRGPLSAEVVVMTSEDVPSESPLNVRCSSLSTQTVYIIWDPIRPDKINGILRGYKTFYKPVDEWYESASHTKKTDVPKLTLQGLEVNTNYSIQVAGMTSMGDGVKSEAVYCKTHEDVPSAPGDIKVLTTSSESMLVAWKAPPRPNGAVLKYNVYARSTEDDNGGSEMRYSKDANPRTTDANSQDARVHSSSTDLVLEVKGLKKDHRYDVWVSAVSAIGEGPRSRIVSQTVSGATVSPKSASFDDIISTPWKRDLTLSCQAVGNPPPTKTWLMGGQPITKHSRIQITIDGTLFIQQLQRDDSGNYTCRFRNQHGNDEVNYALQVLVPPSPPKLGVFAKTMSSLHLKWQQGMTGGDPIKGYILHHKRDGSSWEKRELTQDQDSFILDNLSCGSTYQLYMEAFNNIGIGEPCEVITISTDGEVVPAPPKSQVVREGPTFLSLHLDAWPSGGCPIHRFKAEYRLSSSSAQTWQEVAEPNKLQKRMIITGLTPATRYHVRLTVHTSGGPTVTEYLCATLTTTGGTLAPDHVTEGESDRTVIWLSLDPTILLIAALVLVAVLILILILVCLCICRRETSKPRAKRGHMHMDNRLDDYVMSMQGMNVYPPQFYSTLPRGNMMEQYDDDPSPYATSALSGFCSQSNTLKTGHSTYSEPTSEMSRWGKPEEQFIPGNVVGKIVGDERTAKSVPVTPRRKSEGPEETLFVFPNTTNTGIPI